MADYILIPMIAIRPSPTNPRKRFDEAKLAELADSIKSHGLIQPILVRPRAETGTYEIVAGERRFRANELAGMANIPCIVRDLQDGAVLEIQLLENNQREDVHPLEEGAAIRRIIDAGIYGNGGDAIKRVAEVLGKSVRYVYQRLEFAKLCHEAEKVFLAGAISAMHAVEIARITLVDQAQMLDIMLYAHNYQTGKQERSPECRYSVRELQRWIAMNVTQDLAKVPWDLADEELIPCAGACTVCPKHSVNEGRLLGEPGETVGVCLDRQCFKAKQLAARAKLVEAALAANPGAVPFERMAAEVRCEPDDPRAVPMVVTESGWWAGNLEPGDVIHVIPRDLSVDAKTAEEKRRAADAEKLAKAKQKCAEENAYRKALWDAVAQYHGGLCHGELAKALLTAIATRQITVPDLDKVLKAVGVGKDNVETGLPALQGDAASQALVRIATVYESSVGEWFFTSGRPAPKPKILEDLAQGAGLDLAHIRREAIDNLGAKKPKKGKVEVVGALNPSGHGAKVGAS